jgi:FMN phosphatase YigB (HAD superfamily)
MKKFFFDMDGVLFDWEGSFIPMYGDPARMPEEELKRAKQTIAKIDFYEKLKPLKEGFELFHHLKTLGQVAILTSVGKYDSEEVAEQKKKALLRELGYLPEFHYTKSSKDKAAYASQGVLIDDRAKAVLPFRKAGGQAILFVGSKEEALKEIRKL